MRGWEGQNKAGAFPLTDLPKSIPGSTEESREKLAERKPPCKQQVKAGFLGYREHSSCLANGQEKTPALLYKTGKD